MELTVEGNLTLKTQKLDLLRLTGLEHSIITIVGSSTFPLNVTTLQIMGDFHAQTVQLSNLQALSTGPGCVRFNSGRIFFFL